MARSIRTYSLLTLIFLVFSISSVHCQTQSAASMYSALVRAVQKNDITQVRKLITKGVSVNRLRNPTTPGNPGEDTPLMIAAQKGSLPILKLLLTKGAKLETQATGGYFTALHYAVVNGHKSCVQALLARGADANTANVDGELALLAAAERYPIIAKMLINKGANVNGEDITGSTVLMYAIWGGQLDLVRFLLKKGADVHPKDEGDDTALTHAKKEGNRVIINLVRAAMVK